MAKTIKFYSRQEIAQLRKIAAIPKGEEREQLIKKFAQNTERTIGAIYVKMGKLKKGKNSVKSPRVKKVKDASLITTPNSKKGEFVIPVKNWKLQHENGNLNIVINF